MSVKYKVGDKVKVMGSDKIYEIENVTQWDEDTQRYKFVGVSGWHVVDMELADDPLADKILERNNKPIPTMQSDPEGLAEQLKDAFPKDDPIEPQHYRKGEMDLFEAWYRTRPLIEFRAIMESIAERYMKRDKENRIEDLDKAIYTLERLKEYEELEEEE